MDKNLADLVRGIRNNKENEVIQALPTLKCICVNKILFPGAG